MKRVLCLLLVGLVGCTPQSSAPAPQELSIRPEQELSRFLVGQGYQQIPMNRLATGHFMIAGTADDIPFDLILDTGASHTVIDSQRAGRFDLAVEDRGSRATGVGSASQRVESGQLENVHIGAIRFETLPVAVLDLSHVNQLLRRMGQEPVDGMIGGDVLVQRQAVIDYGSLSVYLRGED